MPCLELLRCHRKKGSLGGEGCSDLLKVGSNVERNVVQTYHQAAPRCAGCLPVAEKGMKTTRYGRVTISRMSEGRGRAPFREYYHLSR
jgi:hypothetical protein